MKIKLLPFFLLLLQLGACSSDIDDRIYGTWVDPFGQSESVTFREDGTVSWFGEEGTFEGKQYENSGGGCDIFCGHTHGLELTLPSGIKTSVYQNIQECPSLSWSLNGVTLYLETELQISMPDHFEKLGEGWGFPENAGCSGFEIASSDPVRAQYPSYSDSNGYLYNPGSNHWVEERHDIIGNDLLLLRKDEESDQWSTSLDSGSTWKALPSLANENIDYFFTPHVTETTVVVRADGGLWTLETTSDSPAWVLRKNIDLFENIELDYVHPNDGIIVLQTQESYPEFIVSHDFGVTWDTFDNMSGWGRCWDRHLHTNGIFCAEGASAFDPQEFRWYDITSRTWTQHEVQFDDFSRAGDPTDGVYIRRGNKIIKWKPNGTETTVTTVLGNEHPHYGTGSFFVFDDQIIVNRFGFWRMWR